MGILWKKHSDMPIGDAYDYQGQSKSVALGFGRQEIFHSGNFDANDFTDDEDEEEKPLESLERYDPPKESVILFIDVDSFEVQLRGMQAGYTPKQLKEEPFIVVNEHGVLTAVNYEAKKFHIRRERGCNKERALELCPHLKVLEIPIRYHKPDALQPRISSNQIYKSLLKSLEYHCRGRPIVEKSSKDEFYVDLSDEVFLRTHVRNTFVPHDALINDMEEARCFIESRGQKVFGEKFGHRILQILPKRTFPRHITEAALVHGASIGYQVLKDIKEETNFICSAGISSNKLLAKVGGGHNKPDAITILPHDGWPRFSEEIKIKDIPRLGGNFGLALQEKFNLENVRQLQNVDRDALMEFRDGSLALQLAMGEDTSQVVEKCFTQTLRCGITFSHATRTMYRDPLRSFNEHLHNRFLEMREHLIYECRSYGERRLPTILKLEISTRKKGLKNVLRETLPLSEAQKVDIYESREMSLKQQSKTLPPPWRAIYVRFRCLIKENCKISIMDDDEKKAAEAIKKISAIELTATFPDASDSDSDEEFEE